MKNYNVFTLALSIFAPLALAAVLYTAASVDAVPVPSAPVFAFANPIH
jgi:hypothetical protein